MSNFMENYEDVNSRIERFKQLYPKGSILTYKEFFEPENGWVMFRCEVRKDAQSDKPDSSDYAFGDRNLYPKNIARFYCEDTATSAQGRALNAVIPTNGKKPTKQDMSKTIKVENESDPWTIKEKPMPKAMDTEAIAKSLDGEIVSEVPTCKHGLMTLKEGTSARGAYHGYVCKFSGVGPGEQCKPIWYELSPAGVWRPRKAN